MSCTCFIHKFYGNLSTSVLHKAHYGGLCMPNGLCIGSNGFVLTDSPVQLEVQLQVHMQLKMTPNMMQILKR